MSLIGNSVTRTDAITKVNGTAEYTGDYVEADLLHGALLRAPLAAGKIRRLNCAKAKSMPGVRAIVTAADTPGSLAGWVLREQPLFAADCVRYEGEPIAGVIADTLQQARAALATIELNIDATPAVGDIDTALCKNAPLVHPDWQTYVPVSGTDHPRYGNVAAELNAESPGVDDAFAGAYKVINDTIVSERQYQAYIEPKSVIGIYRGGRYIVHTGHQYPFNARDRIAQFLDLRASAVRVIGHTIGGGFGGKLDASLEPYAAFMSKFVDGRPVKLINSRAEDMLTCPCRENARVRIRSALDTNGAVLAREVICEMDNGAYTGEMAWMPSVVFHMAGAPYRAPKVRVKVRLVYTNTAPTGAMRGVSGVYVAAAMERHMEHIAAEFGIDSREYRLGQTLKSGAKLLNEQTLDDADILNEAFERLEQHAPWHRLRANKQPYQGIGIGAAVWLTNPMPGAIHLKLNEDGTITAVTCANDNGSGAVAMGLTQIIAENLSIGVDDVIVTMPDTDIAGYDGGSQGSRTTHIVGRAAADAAQELKQKIFATSAGLLEANPGDLELAEGEVRVKGVPSLRLSMQDVALAGTWGSGPLTGSGSYTTPPPVFNSSCASGLLFPFFPTPTYHVHLAQVEVDPVTGNVRVLRYIVVQEVGRAINPSGIKGQIQGAVAQGIGHALYESLRIAESRYVERSLEAYRLPLAVDMPDVEIITMEHPDTAGPYGAKGVGEPAIVPVPGVILNAVSDAVGAPFNTIPITPEAVLEAIHHAQHTGSP